MIPRMNPTSRLTRMGAALALVLAASACGGNDVASTAVPAPSAPSATATGPAGSGPAPSGSASAQGSTAPAASPSGTFTCDASVTGAPAVSDATDPNGPTYTAIEGQVQDLRGIRETSPVQRAVFDQAGLCAYLRGYLAEEQPADLVAATQTLYKHLLLMPENASLQQLYLDMLSSQVVGKYDDKTKTMYVLSKDGKIGPGEEMIYAHEFTHALQDQKFNLRSLIGTATDQSDRGLALSSLVEGDAVLAMTLWAQQHLSPAEMGQVAASVDPASQAVLDRMPAIIKEPLLVPYTQGLTLALQAFTSGGYAGVDALYTDPPASTEQILHPDKLASREKPVAVSFPADLATRLGTGWKVAAEDTMGELLLSIVLKEGGAPAPADAAAGWGGDRVALLEGPSGEVSAVLDTAWDTTADADQFAAALEPMVAKLTAAGRSASVLRPSPDRVVLVSATSPDVMGKVANVLGLAG